MAEQESLRAILRSARNRFGWVGYDERDKAAEYFLRSTDALLDAAERGEWATVGELLDRDGELINACKVGDERRWTCLHVAAHAGAESAVADLVRRGAWLRLRTEEGDLAADLARSAVHVELAGVLEPKVASAIPEGVVPELEAALGHHFRHARWLKEHGLRLPPLDPLLAYEDACVEWSVPGMFGGYVVMPTVLEGQPVVLSLGWSRTDNEARPVQVLEPRHVPPPRQRPVESSRRRGPAQLDLFRARTSRPTAVGEPPKGAGGARAGMPRGERTALPTVLPAGAKKREK